MSFFSELRRRNVVRVGIAYTVIAWLLIQVADVVMENIGAPDWVMKALLFVLVVGALPALIFAWVFELTPEGLKFESEVEAGASVVHQTRRKLDVTIILLLVSAVAYLYWDGRLRDPAVPDPAATAGDLSPSIDSPAAPDDFTPGEKSIAVLPFVNLSSDPEQEYFSDGISEELLNVLAQIPELRVAARTSSFQFKGDNRDIGEIADLLKVQHVLEGSVRKAGTRLRITAQLIEADNGYHLWSETYDRELEDVFAIQDEISRSIAEALKAELALGGEQRAVSETSNKPAYEAFLKGRALLNQRGNPAITAGVRELEKSVRLDPDYAPARAQLAIGITLLTKSSSSYGDLPVTEVNRRAGEQIRIAEALNNDIAELWAAKALLASVNNDPEALIAYAERAIAIRPNYVDPLNWRVNALNRTGRYSESIAAREALLEIDPLSVIGRMNAVTFIAMNDPERAIAIAESIAPQSEWASHTGLANVYLQTHEPVKELDQLLRAFATDAGDLLVNSRLVRLLARYGLEREALRIDTDLRGLAFTWLGRPTEAEEAYRAQLATDPQSMELQVALAGELYLQERYDEAIALYEASLIDTAHGPRVISNGGWFQTISYLDALLKTGRGGEADAIRASVHSALSAVADVNRASGWTNLSLAQLAAVEGDEAALERYLSLAIDAGVDPRNFLDGPEFATYAGSEGFESLRLRARDLHERNRERILSLICDANPVPDEWRPLSSTCERPSAGAD